MVGSSKDGTGRGDKPLKEPLPQRISRVLAWVAGAIILFGCALPITIDVIARLLINRGLVESFEISGYALAACVGLGLAFTVTTKANIRVDFLTAKLPFGLRAGFDLLAAAVLAVVAVALAYFAYGTVAQSVAMNAKSISQLQVPMVIPQGLWWIGLVWFACVAVLVPLQAAGRLIRRDRAGFEALIGSVNVDEEISQTGLRTQEDQT
ncbi:TRAP transporter small permease subunit [Puniceibacterium sp. IMCC21224]|uniref:TRAP transporter small permease subunit n=1 Tax=Puniceibacterium sp. IMCC21224 TaxID=1618204 RepID=UPI00065CF326|nr:TRAP transporter small permease [Puniceibacterium sp. IMCC21224]KMK66328.1 TRAP-type C4-dicarboxylate transport system, small permease component [Puniceibacterium sp. IMCC21224]